MRKVISATWQRCRVHFMRNLLVHAPKGQRGVVSALVRTIFAQTSEKAARAQWHVVADQLQERFPKIGKLMTDAEQDVLAHMSFPREHHSKIYSTNPIERLNGEIKRRTDVVGIFPTRLRSCASSAHSCSSKTTSGAMPKIHVAGNACRARRQSFCQPASGCRLTRSSLPETMTHRPLLTPRPGTRSTPKSETGHWPVGKGEAGGMLIIVRPRRAMPARCARQRRRRGRAAPIPARPSATSNADAGSGSACGSPVIMSRTPGASRVIANEGRDPQQRHREPRRGIAATSSGSPSRGRSP